MAIFLLVISGLLFIITFSIHMILANRGPLDKPMYLYNPLLSAIPLISGIILPVIPFSIVTELHWLAVFGINLVFIFVAGPFLTGQFLIRFASGKGLGHDMVFAFSGAVITLLIGLLLR